MRALALGFFDGVHPGHRAVLQAARDYADAHGLEACAVTLSRHPAAVLAGVPEQLVQTREDRVRTLREAGMDSVTVLPFDDGMRNTPWEDFVRHTLLERLDAGFVSVGYDYRFGRDARGTAQGLKDALLPLGIPVHITPRVDTEDGRDCGTRVLRAMIARGDVKEARALMGRPFSFEGTVQHGKSLGHTLGFPTMNVQLPEELVRPAAGVYAAHAAVRGVTLKAVTNVSPGGLSESFVFDFAGDVYGETIRVYLLEYLRPMRQFDSLASLTAQVMADRETALGVLEQDG